MTLNQRITKLENDITQIANALKQLSKAVQTVLKPYTKTKLQSNQANHDIVYDEATGYFKNYAVYKDDPEEE